MGEESRFSSIGRTVKLVGSLMDGRRHDRYSAAALLQCQPPAAYRQLLVVARLPGMQWIEVDKGARPLRLLVYEKVRRRRRPPSVQQLMKWLAEESLGDIRGPLADAGWFSLTPRQRDAVRRAVLYALKHGSFGGGPETTLTDFLGDLAAAERDAKADGRAYSVVEAARRSEGDGYSVVRVSMTGDGTVTKVALVDGAEPPATEYDRTRMCPRCLEHPRQGESECWSCKPCPVCKGAKTGERGGVVGSEFCFTCSGEGYVESEATS